MKSEFERDYTLSEGKDFERTLVIACAGLDTMGTRIITVIE